VRLLRAIVALMLVAGATLVVGATAGAAPAPSIALVSQDLVVEPDGQASFTFTVGGTLPADTEVVVEAYTKLTNARLDLQRLLSNQQRNRDVGFVATSLDLLTQDGLGRYTIALPTVTSAQQRVLGGNALMPDAGMYPVTIELRADNAALAQLTTAVVRTADAGQPAAVPLDVAIVLSVGGNPTLRADGTTVIDGPDRTRLQTVTSVLAGTATAATVVPRPELIDGLARTGLPADAELRTALRDYMRWAVDNVLRYSPVDAVVPAGAAMPRWDWATGSTARR